MQNATPRENLQYGFSADGDTLLIVNPLPLTRRGVCRYCGCSDSRACTVRVHLNLWRGCAWMDTEHTVCDHPACTQQWIAEINGREPGVGSRRFLLFLVLWVILLAIFAAWAVWRF